MHDDPSITIIFDPLTLELSKIFFNARTDTETARLREILAEGIRSGTDETEPKI
jgi:hypothetical protein